MIKSMTAYGRGEHSNGDRAFTAEIKSVNNRYRDIVLRVPRTLQAVEDGIRSQISAGIRRGRIEVVIQIEKDASKEEYNLELNLPLTRSYVHIFRQLAAELGSEKKIGPEHASQMMGVLCQMKDVIQMTSEDPDIDKIRPCVQEALKGALEAHDTMRAQEGRAIEADFLKRLDLIEGHLDRIEQRASQVAGEYHKSLREKIQRLTQNIEIDDNRLIQEVAIFAEKCDTTEEIVRTRSHLGQFRKYMKEDDAIGRRLDFLLQEIHREVNTLSSKAPDSSISNEVVEIKAELEKIREQVQNVE